MVFNDDMLNILEKYNGDKEQKSYVKGLNDMLRAVRKIYGENENDGFTADELKRIFGTIYFDEIIKEYSANDIVQKIKNYEKAQLEINVGDEVEGKGYWLQGVVTFINKDSNKVDILCKDGTVAANVLPSSLKKTCRHFDVFNDITKLFN